MAAKRQAQEPPRQAEGGCRSSAAKGLHAGAAQNPSAAMKETVSTDVKKTAALAKDIGEDSEEGRRRVNFYDKHKKEILELERLIVERVDKLGVRIKDFVWEQRPEHDPWRSRSTTARAPKRSRTSTPTACA